MTQSELKSLAYNNVKKNVDEPPDTNLVEFVYYLGLVYTYRLAQIDESKAKQYMPVLDKKFKVELALYPDWAILYESCKVTPQQLEQYNKIANQEKD